MPKGKPTQAKQLAEAKAKAADLQAKLQAEQKQNARVKTMLFQERLHAMEMQDRVAEQKAIIAEQAGTMGLLRAVLKKD